MRAYGDSMHRTFQNYREYSAAWANYSRLQILAGMPRPGVGDPGLSLPDTQG